MYTNIISKNSYGVVTTKLPSRRKTSEFYRYYAGFTTSFAQWAIGEMGFGESNTIVDPWHGSGTTAAVCAEIGVGCVGLDVNPVMVHLSRMRIAQEAVFHQAKIVIAQLRRNFMAKHPVSIRDIGFAFQQMKINEDYLRSVLLSSLFPMARDVLSDFKSKNPTWFKKEIMIDDFFCDVESFFERWSLTLDFAKQWKACSAASVSEKLRIIQADSRLFIGEKQQFDGFLTSPPYLTRIDYVHATLAEILMLQLFENITNVKNLRQSMLGTPLTSHRNDVSDILLPNYISNVLKSIYNHRSKASSRYYYKFFLNYFQDLTRTISHLAYTTKPGGRGCVVVQSSHYKEIEIDLGKALTQIVEMHGFRLQGVARFESKRSMSSVNSRANSAARKPKDEVALFLGKT